jgi:hypothetical protein
MNEAKPKRRWFRFRFSLATLFLTITAICLWLSWERSIISEREQVVKLIVSRRGAIDGGFGAGFTGGLEAGVGYRPVWGNQTDRIPKLWTLFGVKPVFTIWIPNGEFTSEELQRIKKAFPELDDWQLTEPEAESK